ncbi:peptidoglycan bridge formation glycyltransferase FemA/FemB family protein [Candidatus Saccharibacteria bacterium]|nr:peptidoglycan bridge formation glycyltransferase FemA/FemB family protein [Candidatus Saccharibacteria bacterium]
MKIAIIEAENRELWDEFVTSHKESNFLQSWDFYEFHASRGNQITRRIAINEKGNIIGAYAGVVETAKRGRHLAIAGGPIIDWHCQELVDKIFEDIKNEGKRLKCVFVRLRPQLELSEKSLKLMKEHGFIKAPMYLSVEYAGILNLEKTESEILAGASQGFRRKLRKAEKNDIEIEVSNDPKVMKDFCELEAKHAERQGYVPFSKSFLTKQFEAFAKNNEVLMYTAKKDGEILAMNFMIFYGPEASYHYGVSSDLGTKYSGAPLMHLKAMEEARRRGIKRYNLWGIVGQDETSHRFYGVSEFKRSFGCEELKYTPAHDFVINKAKYKLTKLIETARKRHRHV